MEMPVRFGEAWPSFVAWLLEQDGNDGFIGQLTDAAAKDRTFPREGNVDPVKRWLQARGASGVDWEALDDELGWLSQ